MAEVLIAAHIIRAAVHIQVAQDLLTDLQVHPTDLPDHLTDLQDLLIRVIPEVQEAADTAAAAEAAVDAAVALLHFYFCFWS